MRALRFDRERNWIDERRADSQALDACRPLEFVVTGDLVDARVLEAKHCHRERDDDERGSQQAQRETPASMIRGMSEMHGNAGSNAAFRQDAIDHSDERAGE